MMHRLPVPLVAAWLSLTGAFPLYAEDSDPHDPRERFVLLAPGGPLVVEVSLTIDGQPFRMAREKLIDEMLAATVKNSDGQITWAQALATKQFILGQRIPRQNQNKDIASPWDKNSDGLVDRSEVRQFLAQRFGGPAFLVTSNPGNGLQSQRIIVSGQQTTVGGAMRQVHTLLDADSDGSLSEQEIAAAPERLKSQDADDNDLLLPHEIGSAPRTSSRKDVIPAYPTPIQSTQWTMPLGPNISADMLYTVLSQRYRIESGPITAAAFGSVPKLFAELDQDRDGKLQKFEAARLSDLPPQLVLSVDLGHAAPGQGLAVKSLSPEMVSVHASAQDAMLELSGVRIALHVHVAAPRDTNYQAAAAPYLARFDKDRNGYLEASEVPAGLTAQLAQWDADEDGKVYAPEIAAAFARSAAPAATQAVAIVSGEASSLFRTLDYSGDGRLSMREMQSSAERIKRLDKDRDGRISDAEIPSLMVVSFALASDTGASPQFNGGNEPAPASPAADPPEWFIRMDRNGDGDLTLREFLGDESDFRTLDADGDGFVDGREARAASRQ